MPVDTTWPTGLTTNIEDGGLQGVTDDNISPEIWNRVMSALNHIGGATGIRWTSFTPTLFQNGSGVTMTVDYARYAIIGKTALVQVKLTVAGPGAAGIIKLASIPAAIAPARQGDYPSCAGTVIVFDSGAASYVGAADFASSTEVQAMRDGGTNFIGADPSFALASGDELSWDLMYELA